MGLRIIDHQYLIGSWVGSCAVVDDEKAGKAAGIFDSRADAELFVRAKEMKLEDFAAKVALPQDESDTVHYLRGNLE